MTQSLSIQNNKNIVSTSNPKSRDIYSDTPVRLLGFTNEVGAAISPIVGPVGELISYAPALGYIAMDTHDKYQRGEDNTYQKPCHKKATSQLIFQMMASVILPTAAVKSAQAIANKIIDSKQMQPHKEKIVELIQKNESVHKFLHQFADKPHDGKPPSKLKQFAHKFEKVINHITVAPLFFKSKSNKTGLRNVSLAIIGLGALGLAIKPIDHLSEKFIHHAAKPVIDKVM